MKTYIDAQDTIVVDNEGKATLCITETPEPYQVVDDDTPLQIGAVVDYETFLKAIIK